MNTVGQNPCREEEVSCSARLPVRIYRSGPKCRSDAAERSFRFLPPILENA